MELGPHSYSFIAYTGPKLFYPYCIEIVSKEHFPDNDLKTARNISSCVK